MTTLKQDKDFISAVITEELLELSIQWIGDNLSPEEVFSEDELESWAEKNGFVKQ